MGKEEETLTLMKKRLADAEEDAQSAFRHMCHVAPSGSAEAFASARRAWETQHERLAALVGQMYQMKVRDAQSNRSA
jgi:hypothetical protein